MSVEERAAVEKSPVAKEFANIAENTYYKILFNPELEPSAKKAAVTKALTFAESAEASKEKLEEFVKFKEYLQFQRKRMAQQIIALTDTEAFSELQAVYQEINNALLEFENSIEYAYHKAASERSIIFVEMPSEKMITRKIYNQITDIVNGLTVNEISMHQIKNNYETQGFALVLVTGTDRYWDIVEYLQQNTDTSVSVVSPALEVYDVEPCLYDKILSERVAREAFEHAQIQTNFIIGGGGTVKFEDYLDIV